MYIVQCWLTKDFCIESYLLKPFAISFFFSFEFLRQKYFLSHSSDDSNIEVRPRSKPETLTWGSDVGSREPRTRGHPLLPARVCVNRKMEGKWRYQDLNWAL